MEDKLECRVLTDFAELEVLSTDWTRLQTATGKGEIFQHFDWTAVWWKSFGKDHRFFTLIVLRKERIVGILPLALIGRRLRFLGYNVSDYNHFLAEPGEADAALERCLDTLRGHAGEWDEIQLENVPESSLLAESLRHLPRVWQRSIVATPGDPCPTMLLTENKHEVLKSSMDKLKRAVNRLRRANVLIFRHIEDPAEMAAHLPQFFKQHIRRSAMAGRRSGFLDHDYVSFYGNLLDRVGVDKVIRFSVLELGGQPVAYHFGLQYQGKYLWYKPSFDIDLWDLAPGQGMLWHLFEHQQTAGIEEFDFGRGDEAFKYRFSNHVRRNLNFTVYAPGYRSAIRRACRRVRETTKTLVGKSPKLEQAMKQTRDIWRDTLFLYRRAGTKPAMHKILRTSGIDKEESWVLFIDRSTSGAPSPREQDATTVKPISLGGLADMALTNPGILDEQALQKARELFRQKLSAWVVSAGGQEEILAWTSIDTELTAPAGKIELPDKAMIVLEIWPLIFRTKRKNYFNLLRQLSSTANAMGLTMWAVCPKRFLPAEDVLRGHGVIPKYRWVRSRILGKTRWEQHEFG
ncbi:MAG: GNAT family N-acetyltransferase [Sulfuricaulis sp.]